MVDYLLEHGALEEAHDSRVRLQVPDDAGAVVAGGDCLGVCLVDLDVGHSASVLLEGSLHDLGLLADAPDPDFSLHASRDYALAVVGGGEGGDSVVVGVVDGVEELARLGEEGADLAVVPAREDALAVVHELDAEALEAWDLNAQQLLASLHVPHSDVVQRAGGEQL